MTSWETCNIELVTLRAEQIKVGLFTERYVPGIYRWEARAMDSSGSHVSYRSEEFEIGFREKAAEGIQAQVAAYNKLIAQLSSEGWEPSATNEQGFVTLMRRQVKASKFQQMSDPTELLQQLTNLRDAGILTEEEFKVKKIEIIKRM
jgi:hypothetical protein